MGTCVDMPEGLNFRADLYRATASFYDRFRLSYPAALIADLIDRTRPDGSGRLLGFREQGGAAYDLAYRPPMV